ncbi:MAG: hypothetical protein V3U88_02935 [Methylococcales bacterium]
MKKSTLKKLAIATGVAAAIAAPASQASIVDHPFFRVLGVVIVWGADSTGTAPIASDFVLMNGGTGTEGNDLIGTDVHAVVTGTLGAVPAISAQGNLMDITGETSGGVLTDAVGANNGFLDAGDSLTAFGLDTTTDVEVSSNSVTHSFYVASNTAFDIKAVTALDAASTGDLAGLGLAGIGYELDVTVSGDDGLAFGGNAQDPSTGGTTPLTAASTLATINGNYVFDGGQRTALSAGAIAGQSVRFDATYTLAGGAYDLSQGTGLLAADVTYTIFVP